MKALRAFDLFVIADLVFMCISFIVLFSLQFFTWTFLTDIVAILIVPIGYNVISSSAKQKSRGERE